MSFRTIHQLRLFLCICACTCAGANAAYAAEIGVRDQSPIVFAEWQPQKGDELLVDTEENIGYLIRLDGTYTAFPVATGQRRVVRYIGRTYNATTPASLWKAKSSEIKGDRITFGKYGRFLRLYEREDSEETRTPYGIHSHAYIEKMLAGTERYRSMGCVLVSEFVLDRIIETFALNGNELSVRTINGLGDETLTYEVLKEKMTGLQESGKH